MRNFKETALGIFSAAILSSASSFADGFSAQILASFQDPKMEWWFNLPADSAPNVVQTDRVFFHQDFSLFSFFEKAAVKDGNFAVKYSVYSIAPDGRRKKISENVSVKGKKPSQNIIVASTEFVSVCFDKNSPEGLYEFEIEANDEISGAKSTYKTKVRLADWTSPMPMLDKKIVDETILGFYNNPSPEKLYSAFFSKELNLEQKGAPNNLNYIYLGFFQAAFKRNSFLIPIIRDAFRNASPLDRAKTIFLFAILDEARVDVNLLTPKEKEYQEAMRNAQIPDPYKEWDNVVGAVQIDMLWGEFFADGTYRPVRRIMDLLSYVEEAKFTHKSIAENKKPEKKEDWKKLMLGAYHTVALQSLLANAQRFPLVKKYCLWAIENRNLPDSTYQLLGDVADKK